MTTEEFLSGVITAKEGWLCLAYLQPGSHGWWEEWFQWPIDLEKVVTAANSKSAEYNVYFSTYLFSAKHRNRELALPTRTIQADLDEADLKAIPLPPFTVVESSPGRHQAYWVLETELELSAHELLSRKLTYSIPRCDHSGWPVGRMLRLPGTLNHKYADGPHKVIVSHNTRATVVESDFELLVDQASTLAMLDTEWIDGEKKALGTGPLELLESVKSNLPTKVYGQYSIEAKDRSAALWALMCACFRSGLDRDQTFWLASQSANNKFRDLHHNGPRELAKDVLRAEQVTKASASDPRTEVLEARRVRGAAPEKRLQIARIVHRTLKSQGHFTHAKDDTLWFTRLDIGRPIQIAGSSNYLNSLLDVQFGLNRTETEQRYTTSYLEDMVREIPPSGRVSALSYYLEDQNAMLLHTGRKEVVRINPASVETVINGAYDVLFPWVASNDPFQILSPTSEPWYEVVFAPFCDNVLDMEHDQALALLRTWLIFVLFRNMAMSRPLLAMFGQPGSIGRGSKVLLYKNIGGVKKHIIPIEEAYDKFNSSPSSDIRTLSQKDGIIRWLKVRNIFCSGMKYTYTVKVAGCESFRATIDHQILTPDGYKPLFDLKVGDLVSTIGKIITSSGNNQHGKKRAKVQANFHPHGWEYTMRGYGPYRRIYNSRAAFEARMNGMSTNDFLVAVNDEVAAKALKYLPFDIDIHHKDNDLENDDPDNLVVMDHAEHAQMHGFGNVRNFGHYSGLFTTSSASIESIEYFGEDMTYDIEMEDQDVPNFLVNGVVVHNSGKSTLCRLIYKVLYGAERALETVTVPEQFDHAVSINPVVILDNLDTWERWLPDRLAQSISNTDIMKRMLYTDVDTARQQRQAVIGVNAHNPRFVREDVADRLLLLTFERLEQFGSEKAMIKKVLDNRGRIWGGIVQDIQKVLATPMPNNPPQFRVEDFAQVGWWIATALGMRDDFAEALKRTVKEQKSFTLEEQGILINAIKNLCNKQNGTAPWYSMGQLWTELEVLSGNSQSFEHIYKNAVRLGQKLWSLEDALKEMFVIERKVDPARGGRVWSFKLR